MKAKKEKFLLPQKLCNGCVKNIMLHSSIILQLKKELKYWSKEYLDFIMTVNK